MAGCGDNREHLEPDMERLPRTSLRPRTVVGAGRWAVGNRAKKGAEADLFAVSRRCRHLGADLAKGGIDPDGCLVCPWHQARYDVSTGHMVRGPQGVFAKVPGLGLLFTTLTRVLPLGRGTVTTDGDEVVVR
jgi:nitrite reductase/ring-hydroxylating ferredoxin subunit